MLGAIVGDVVGSVYEHQPIKTSDFPLFSPASRFTDDTVLSVATAQTLLRGGANADSYRDGYREWFQRYSDAGYGQRFRDWGWSCDDGPYQSFGNGSAMRVAPVGWAFSTLEQTLEAARQSAAVTHDHPEGIKGAQAVAAAIFWARTGESKATIRDEIRARFGYPLNRSIDQIRPGYTFDVTCQGSVPEAIRAFLESENFEQAIRLAVSLGGDADTQACIAGAIAEAFYGGVPAALETKVRALLPSEMLTVINEFRGRFID